MDAKTWTGVQLLLDEYAQVGPDDFVVLLYATDSAEPVAWVSTALELRAVAHRRVWLNPLHDEGFPDRLQAAVPAPDEIAGDIVVISLERDTLSHHSAVTAALASFPAERRRIFRAINASAELFSKALQVAPAHLASLNTALLERCFGAERLRITTRGGTDLRVRLDSRKYRWVSNRGSAREGGVVVLPAGEIATFPAAIDGVLVADFAFNVNLITRRDARLHDRAVTVWIENGRAVRWACEDPEIRTFLDECFRKHCVCYVGELGFGTNIGVDEGIALNSHINERRPGVHLGFGQHNQDPAVAGYSCHLHLDLIARGGEVWFDDDAHPVDLERVVGSANPHPTSPRDEDAFTPEGGVDQDESIEEADCCGVLGCDGLILAGNEQEVARVAERL
ncbi:hypothetical protein [Luteimonas abyssi]|uniref:hypothetical protein n=1 Tax=Luteimonas abyssi TaxID=1247514 RepID=UPI000737D733|nr:hypothetical protein [Luteimonas abyssi]